MVRWQWHQLDHMQIICTSLQTHNYATTPFLRDGCRSCHPTNSVKALKAQDQHSKNGVNQATYYSTVEFQPYLKVLKYSMYNVFNTTVDSLFQTASMTPISSILNIAVTQFSSTQMFPADRNTASTPDRQCSAASELMTNHRATDIFVCLDAWTKKHKKKKSQPPPKIAEKIPSWHPEEFAYG